MAQLKVCAAAGCEEISTPGLPHCDEHEQRRKARLKQQRAKAQTSPAAIMARRHHCRAGPRLPVRRAAGLR